MSDHRPPTHDAPDGTSRSGAAALPWYRSRKFWTRAALVSVGLAVFLGLGIAAAYWSIYSNAEIPPPEELAIPDPTVVLDREGTQIAKLDPAAVRKNIAIGDLPRHVPQAVMAAEDRKFHDHEGWSGTAIMRAFWANLRSGETVQGASTITQQYVELAVEEVDQSYLGKFREVAVAAKLDDQLPKDQILEFYLNAVPFGRGAVGIEAAARTYFGVGAAELDANQAATLAGMIAAPSAYDPGRNPDKARVRRDFVLNGMVETGALTRSEADELIGQELPELNTDPLFAFGPNAYFLDAVREQLPGLLNPRDADNLFSNLVVETTVDQRIQKLAIESVNAALEELPYSGAIVTIDPTSGAVVALVGGRDYEQQQFNVAFQGTNQVGSSFKPFVLTEFVAQGFDPRRSTVESPEVLELPSGDGTAEIRNYTRTGYHPDPTVRDATIRSINTAYVNLALELGLDNVVARTKELGVDSEIPAVPAVSIGAADLTPLEMAEAYATLAGEGVHREPFLITRVTTHDGQVLYEHRPEEREILDPNVAAVVTDTLRGVVESGTGTAAQLDRPVAGKTGTTNDSRDAWFVGYTPRFATAVWIGNLDNSPMDGVTGGSIPAELWGAYMAEVVAPFDPLEFPEPDYSGLDARYGIDGDANSDDRDKPSPSPTPEPSPSPSPSPEPSPSPSPEPSPSPSPKPKKSPEPEPSPTTSDEPSPTEGGGGDGGGGDGGGGSSDPSPSPSPTDG